MQWAVSVVLAGCYGPNSSGGSQLLRLYGSARYHWIMVVTRP